MNPYVGYILVVVIIIIVIYFLYYGVSKYLEKQSKSVQNIKSILEKYGNLKENGIFLEYHYKEVDYSVLIIKVQKGAKFTFNSKVIWEKRFGSKKFYTDQTIFSKKPGKKIVVIYPSDGPFMYHYDENEIRFTNPKEKIWDMHIVSYQQLESVLEEGFK